jgi:hypothetical protein
MTLGFYEFYKVLRGSTGGCRVLPGSTGFGCKTATYNQEPTT